MNSENYKQLLINERSELSAEDFKSTLEHYADLYLKEKLQTTEQKVTDEDLMRIVWDGFLIAQRQPENWHDEDTCRLIVRKLLNKEPIEYAKGDLP